MIGVSTSLERWALREPFATARDSITHVPVVVATLTDADGHRGRGEAAGVDYDGETPEGIAAQVESVRGALEDGLTGTSLLGLLPAGGARNALDCALWDLRAKQSGRPAWRLAGLDPPRPVLTACTIGIADDATTRRRARALAGHPLVKLKVDADRALDIVRIAREELPGTRLVVDANQSWTRARLERLLPALRDLGVELVEQPLPRGADAELDGLEPCIPLAADESCTDRASLAGLAGRYDFVNLKLDKCGGLTEALATADSARRLGLGLMVGNMCGTSLAMAPACLLAQRCRYVDLDGPLLQAGDRSPSMRYAGGYVEPPDPGLWG
ncbi:MAG: N-acetyl-D-Glu racemase DgcA [Steroidobacteraceae bacterium]